MFPRSERFVEKIEITPGPNHYDVKLTDDDPYKRFGFLGKTKRFGESPKNHSNDSGSHHLSSHPTSTHHGSSPYERSSLAVSLPSLIIDDDASSVHSNGSTTPDYPSRRPTAVGRSRSSDKLGTATGTHKAEERLKKELADLTDKFEKYRLSHQRDLDALSEKQKKSEVQYQGAIKEKNSILTQLAAKESEIAELVARQARLKTSLDKSEKVALSVAEKTGKSTQQQKRIEELEKLLARSRASLEEQESMSKNLQQKLDQERQEALLQSNLQKETSEQELARVQALHQAAEDQYRNELRIAKEDSDHWRRKLEALEQRIRELEEQLEAERRLVAELQEMMKRERIQLQEKIDLAHTQLAESQRQNAEMTAKSHSTIGQLEREKETMYQDLQSSLSAFTALESVHKKTECDFAEHKVQHVDTVATMSRKHEEQQELLSKERQENIKTRSTMERSISQLTDELSQSRDTLLKVQQDRASLKENYDASQTDLRTIEQRLEDLNQKYEKLTMSAQQERDSSEAKYSALLSASSLEQKQASEVAADLRGLLDKKEEELARVMQTISTVQAELHAVESEREEVIALRQQESKESEESLKRIKEMEEQKVEQDRLQHRLEQEISEVRTVCQRLQDEAMQQDESIIALKSEVEQERTDKLQREAEAQKRIRELEEIYLVATRQAETFHDNEKVWESERTNLLESSSSQRNLIQSLQSQLETQATEREQESEVNKNRVQELEDRCTAMEKAFLEMYEKVGSPEVEANSSEDDWHKHSRAVVQVIDERSLLTKDEHDALLDVQSAHSQCCASLTTALQDRESSLQKVMGDQASYLAKIQELEDMIRVLKAQVEFLEAENIGKEAIIKALQDEYEYQEKVIKDLIKNEDAAKDVTRLEEELRIMTDHTRKTDEWIRQVQEDVEKYRAAYVKADLAREETLLDMAKLHEELEESEQARLQVENQLQVEVGILIKKHELSNEELSRLSKMTADSAQNQGLKQKAKQLAQLKEEAIALKKKNLSLSNTRDSLRLKCLQVERELEAYKAASCVAAPSPRSNRQSRASSVTSASSVILSGTSSLNIVANSSPESSPVPGARLQLQGLVSSDAFAPTQVSPPPPQKISPKPTSKATSSSSRPVLQSRAARTVLAIQSTAR
ncbi:hypothetical protein EMPS_10440 [Entomortierella parvispora]|uniref:Hyaluronan-mediated motility receptor C-terminal domain-containing protein n=1 Tax=Entomortierella parvispora TaxID=205924 RepID=A0A9P3HK45_9FUNG|nr:hypothetical protein EMPS_10440 [Entomortierella parvispora]